LTQTPVKTKLSDADSKIWLNTLHTKSVENYRIS
jgi:hypothetical protein